MAKIMDELDDDISYYVERQKELLNLLNSKSVKVSKVLIARELYACQEEIERLEKIKEVFGWRE